MITNVTFTLNGSTYPLTLNDGVWSAEITAPAESSWYEPNHAFVGLVHVDSEDDLGLTYYTEEEASIRFFEDAIRGSKTGEMIVDWCLAHNVSRLEIINTHAFPFLYNILFELFEEGKDKREFYINLRSAI